MRLSILAFGGCMASAVAGLLDAFTIAGQYRKLHPGSNSAAYETAIVTADGAGVRGFGGFPIPAARSLAQAGECDAILVPPIMDDIVGTLEREQALITWLRAAKGSGALFASICTGAFFLAEAGLLDGKQATTNPAFSGAFRRRYPQVPLDPSQRIAIHPSVVCAGSTTAFLDLALHLVERFDGHEAAIWTAKMLSMDRNAASQRPYFLFIAPRDHGDDRMLAMQDWIETHFASPLTLDTLAGQAAMSLRNFTRRFREATGLSPADYLRAVRIAAAKRMLEGSDLAIERIAEQSGYQDARAFSRAFSSEVGQAPGAYRRRFHRSAAALA